MRILEFSGILMIKVHYKTDKITALYSNYRTNFGEESSNNSYANITTLIINITYDKNCLHINIIILACYNIGVRIVCKHKFWNISNTV